MYSAYAPLWRSATFFLQAFFILLRMCLNLRHSLGSVCSSVMQTVWDGATQNSVSGRATRKATLLFSVWLCSVQRMIWAHILSVVFFNWGREQAYRGNAKSYIGSTCICKTPEFKLLISNLPSSSHFSQWFHIHPGGLKATGWNTVTSVTVRYLKGRGQHRLTNSMGNGKPVGAICSKCLLNLSQKC